MSEESLSLSSVFRELMISFTAMVRGEVLLAKAEIRETASQLRRDVFRFMSFASLAAAGLLPFMAFLVLGLGKILGDRYILSSFIVATFSMGVGLGVSYFTFQKAARETLQLPRTLHSFEERLDSLNKKLDELSETAKRSAA